MRDNFYERYPALLPQETNINLVINEIVECHSNSGKVMLCGNGGSAADCDHWAAELLKNFLIKREMLTNEIELPEWACHPGVKAIPLPSLTAACTAISNDMGSGSVFSQLVNVLANAADVLICLSTSGTSENIVSAAITGKFKAGISTILMTGDRPLPDDDDPFGYFDIIIKAPSKITHEIQEYHLAIYHYISAMVEDKIWGNNSNKGDIG